MEDPFEAMPQDPREASHADLRSSERDRDAVLRALGEAYAEGRLEREEHDERTDRVQRSRTLGELPPVLSDLLPHGGRAPRPRAPATVAPVRDLVAQAERRYHSERRQAVWTAMSASIVCLAIWLLTSGFGFFWPAFVILGTGLNAGRVVFQREDIVADHLRSLEKDQAKAEKRRRREIGGDAASPGPDDGDL